MLCRKLHVNRHAYKNTRHGRCLRDLAKSHSAFNGYGEGGAFSPSAPLDSIRAQASTRDKV